MKRRFFLVLLSCFAVFATAGSLRADDVSDAKARMRERVAQLDQLKLAEAIGETNRGFVEVRKADAPNAAALADAENRDRSTVFNATASRAGSSPDAVGRAFAKQIAAASAPGVWVQRDDGSWHKK